MTLENILIYTGFSTIVLALLFIIIIILVGIYYKLQKLHSFWKIAFLYFKTKIYYKEIQLTLKSPNGKYYKVVEVKDEN